MIQLTRASQCSTVLKGDLLSENPIVNLIKQFDTDEVALYTDYLTSRLWSNYNHYKVEAHSIITKSLYLMKYFEVFIDFANWKVFFTSEGGKEYFIEYTSWDFLGHVLYALLEASKDSDELNYNYSDYRQHTRSITDRLEESTPTNVIWSKLVHLTETYTREA